MIDHTRIRTGFDVEVQLGANFFLTALHAVREAGDFPAEVALGNIRVALEPPSAVRIVHDVAWDLEVDVPVTFSGIDDLAVNPFPATIRCAVDIEHSQNRTTCLNDRADLHLRYVGLDQRTLDNLATSATLSPFLGALDGMLAPELDRDLPNLVPGTFTRMAVVKLRGEDGHQPCFAILLDLPIKIGPVGEFAEPADAPINRGDTPSAVSFLPADLDIAVGCPPALYGRLAADIMHGLERRTDDGRLTRPLMNLGERIGRVRKLSLGPPLNLTASGEIVEQRTDTIKLHAEVTMETDVEIDATQDITLRVSISPTGDLELDPKVHQPEADTSWIEALAVAALFVVFALIPGGLAIGLAGAGLSLFGGLAAGAGVMSAITVGFIRLTREQMEERAQRRLSPTGSRGIDDVFAALPSKVTIVRKRNDPFFYTHHMTRTAFTEVQFTRTGMSFGGIVSTARETRPVEGIRLVSRVRRSEPDGELLSLEYEVPDVGRPVSVERAMVSARVGGDQLQRLIVHPRRVQHDGDHITEMMFEHGGALAPWEVAELQRARAVLVSGYRLIVPDDGRPYYRADPDGRVDNNLANLPRYRAYKAAQLALRYRALYQRHHDSVTGIRDEVWAWPMNATGRSALPAAAHRVLRLFSGLVRMLQLTAGGTTTVHTFASLDQLARLPDGEPDDFRREQMEGAAADIGEGGQRAIEALDEEGINREYQGAMVPGPVTAHGLGAAIMDWLDDELRAFRRAVSDAAAEEREANPPPESPPPEERPPCAPAVL